MRAIPLSQGKEAIVDDEDFKRFGAMRWHARHYSKYNSYYAAKSQGNGNNVLPLHRAILGVTDPRVFVDHINHDTLDCRRSNLRLCTNAQNQHNRNRATSRSKTGILGVTWNKRKRKYRAGIHVAGKAIHLGDFADIAAAANARIEAARHHYGQFFGGH